MVALALRTTTMVQIGTCPRAIEPRRFSSRASLPRLRRSAQQLADSCCCIQVIAASSAMGEKTCSRTRTGKHATLGWFSPPHFSRDVARCGHPLRHRCRRSVVGVLVSRRLFGRRSVRSKRAASLHRDGGRARDTRCGWFSPPQSSRAVCARRGGLLLLFFSRPVAGRRPRLAPSLRPPLRAERGRGARGATGDACATRAARVRRRGWFSPPQSSRAVFARRGGLLLLLFSRPVAGRRPRLAPSLRPPLRAERGRGGRRATGGRARDARRGWFSPPQSSRVVRARRGGLFFSCSSPVRSPVVVLVSRLLDGRRSTRSEGGGGDGGQARDARGARASLWVVLAAAVEQGRSRAPRWSLLLLLFSRPVRRSAVEATTEGGACEGRGLGPSALAERSSAAG